MSHSAKAALATIERGAETDPTAALAGQLSNLAMDVLERCRRQGADQVEVGVSDDHGLEASVRMGEVETLQLRRDRGLSLTVYYGKRKGSASTADFDPSSIATTIEQACAIARFTEADPCSGLADADRMATEFPELDLWHPWAIDADGAVELALRCEQAGRDADPKISNSDGASVSTGRSLSVYANSHGFVGAERSTAHSISCSLIGGSGDSMQRDYWYDATCASEDLQNAEAVGREAARRTLARLGPRSLATGEYPVLFAAETARSLIGGLIGAVSGGAQYRKASFLLDSIGTTVMPSGISLIESPHLRRGHRSAAFDDEGVATAESALVEAGVLQRYLLGSYSARKLGLSSTGNAGGLHNLDVRIDAADLREADLPALLRRMGRGLLVTEMMGQGGNTLTGDYSRGAAGFWVENGEIAYPVDELTIASNLREMLLGVRAVGGDIDSRSAIRCGSILLDRMTVGGDG